MIRRFVLVLLLVAAAPGAWSAPIHRVVSQDREGLEVELTFPDPEFISVDLERGRFARVRLRGGASRSLEGRPEIPSYGVPFAVPPGTRAVFTLEILEEELLNRAAPLPVPRTTFEGAQTAPTAKQEFVPDPDVYERSGWFPEQDAFLSEVDEWRFHRVQSLVVNPVRVDLSRNAYRVIKRARARIRFEPTGDSAPTAPAPPQSRGWQALAERMVVNAETAERSRPRPRGGLAAAAEAPAPGVRLKLSASGLVRVSYEDLQAAGFPANTPNDAVRVAERNFDDDAIGDDPYIVNVIPRLVEDTDLNNVFGPGDHLVFYGENYRDRFNPLVADERYTRFHTYWITTEGGVDFPLVEPSAEPVEQTAGSFQSTVRAEENEIYTHIPNDQGGGFYPTYTAVYWRGPTGDALNATVVTPDPDPEGVALFTGYWRGNFVDGDFARHLESVILNGNVLLERAQFVGTNDLNWFTPALDNAGLLNNGNNSLRVVGERLTNQGYLNGSGAYFDHIEIKYDRLLKARNDAIRFNSRGYQGVTEFSVSEFTSPDIWVLDVTDPRNPVRILADVSESQGAYTVTFAWNVTGEPREFFAVAPKSFSGLPDSDYDLPEDIAHMGLIGEGALRDLDAAGRNSDYIIITHPRFRSAMESLADHRRSRGLNAFVCEVQEVYDQFSGGRKTPDAFKSFLRLAYQTWETPPTYLVLGGDGNEDYRNETSLSTVDWVPTMMHTAHVPGALGDKELAGTDTWFGQGLAAGEGISTVAPDMFVGRLPANTLEQAQRLVTKTINYEKQDGQPWHNRGVFQADDQYSQGLTINSTYCYQANEGVFDATTQDIVERIVEEGGYVDFDAVTFFQSAHLDTVDALMRDTENCPNLITTRDYVRTDLSPALLDTLEAGGLIWEYTGHANASLMTTEAILQAQVQAAQLTNLGKPYVFLGFACHLAEFERALEKRGRSISEVMMSLDNRGIVASFASTGYEWLSTNGPAQVAATAPFFWDVPRDPLTGKQRRILGEALFTGIYKLYLATPSVNHFQLNRTYILLGDPALAMDMFLPSLSVEVNGAPVESGQVLEADTFGAGLELVARINEDVDIESLTVSRGGEVEDPEAYTLTLLTPDDSGLQKYDLNYATTLAFGNSDIVIEARDWSGGSTRFELPARVEFGFTKDGVPFEPEGVELFEEDTILGGEIQSPAPLTAGAFAAEIDGRPLSFQTLESAPGGRRWTFTLDGPWPKAPEEAAPTLALVVSHEEESVRSEIRLRVPSDALELSDLAFYPNPMEGREGTLMYYLTNTAESVDLDMYSISGREVFSAPLEGRPGWNYFTWEGVDELGDPVANGVYLAVIRVGSSIRRMERIVVAR